MVLEEALCARAAIELAITTSRRTAHPALRRSPPPGGPGAWPANAVLGLALLHPVKRSGRAQPRRRWAAPGGSAQGNLIRAFLWVKRPALPRKMARGLPGTGRSPQRAPGLPVSPPGSRRARRQWRDGVVQVEQLSQAPGTYCSATGRRVPGEAGHRPTGAAKRRGERVAWLITVRDKRNRRFISI